MTKAPKINCTNRILLANAVIYCSCDVVRDVNDLLVRCNQRFAPLKGTTDELRKRLKTLTVLKPAHFAKSSITIINGRS